ncbi:MAG: disulfide bond formation protein DsbA [Actinomycetota bacterium]
MTDVDLWIDPTCPFAWMTSRWLVGVAAERDVAIRWRLMSLAVVNEAEFDAIPEAYRAAIDASWRALRTLHAADAAHGNAALGALYGAIGTRHHVGRRPIDTDLLVEALAEAGLPEGLLVAADDETLDVEIRRSHGESQEVVGTSIGTPILRVAGRAFFGPVVNPAPKGEDALRLFDAVVALAAVPQFSELKRGRALSLDLS